MTTVLYKESQVILKIVPCYVLLWYVAKIPWRLETLTED